MDMAVLLQERDRCPACRAAAHAVLVSENYGSATLRNYLEEHYQGRADVRSLGGYSFELRRCAACALVYQRMVPGEGLLSDIYERWIPPSERSRLAAGYRLDDYRYCAEQVEFLILRSARPPDELRVLDFGLGWSEWARMARAYGCRVSGVELSQERCDYARSQGIEIIDPSELPGRQFDFINTEQVFEHLLEPRTVLATLVAALAPGGLLKLSVPESRATLRKIERDRSLAGLSKAQFMPVAPLEHVNSFEHRSLVALGRSLGLAPLRPRLAQIFDSASGWWRPRRAARLVARATYRFVYPQSTFVYFVRAHS